jgi:hypothetical protein
MDFIFGCALPFLRVRSAEIRERAAKQVRYNCARQFHTNRDERDNFSGETILTGLNWLSGPNGLCGRDDRQRQHH